MCQGTDWASWCQCMSGQGVSCSSSPVSSHHLLSGLSGPQPGCTCPSCPAMLLCTFLFLCTQWLGTPGLGLAGHPQGCGSRSREQLPPSPCYPSVVPLPPTLTGWPAWARFVLAVALSSQDLSNPQHRFWGALAPNWSSDPEGKAAASCPKFRTWQGKDAVMEVEIPVQGSLVPFLPALLAPVP